MSSIQVATAGDSALTKQTDVIFPEINVVAASRLNNEYIIERILCSKDLVELESLLINCSNPVMRRQLESKLDELYVSEFASDKRQHLVSIRDYKQVINQARQYLEKANTVMCKKVFTEYFNYLESNKAEILKHELNEKLSHLLTDMKNAAMELAENTLPDHFIKLCEPVGNCPKISGHCCSFEQFFLVTMKKHFFRKDIIQLKIGVSGTISGHIRKGVTYRVLEARLL
jgi:hypothetical protein